MGDDEHVRVVRRVVTPPALPLLASPVPAADRPEHVAAYHAGADVLARFLDDPRAGIDLAALLVVRLAPGGQRNDPVVKPLAALAERVLLALVRAGNESVRRDRDVTPELAHRAVAPSGLGVLRSVVVAAGGGAAAGGGGGVGGGGRWR